MDYVWEKIQVTNGVPSEKILIIARNFRYMYEWCRIHGINYNSHMVKFVTRAIELRGISEYWYVDLGTDDEELRVLLERLKAIYAIKPLLEPNI